MAKKSKLHEVIAVEPALKERVLKILNETMATFTKRDGHFIGRQVTFESSIDDDNKEDIHAKQLEQQVASDIADKQQEIVTTVTDKLTYTGAFLVKAWDAALQIATTNGAARADVLIDDNPIATELPAVFLLEMEKNLRTFRGVCEKIPTLDPSKDFKLDDDKGAHIYRAKDQERVRMKKVRRYHTMVKPTEHHPAQVDILDEDVPVGTVKTQEWSAKFTPAEKSDLLGRIDQLQDAVKQARIRANQQEVDKRKAGTAFMKFILENTIVPAENK